MKKTDNSITQQMGPDWDERADEDPFRAIIGRRIEPGEFWASGENDIEVQVLPFIEAVLNNEERDTALEIGCGAGRLLIPLSRHFARTTGVDVSSEMVRLAQEYARNYPQIDVLPSDGTMLTAIPDQSMAFVLVWGVFQHLPTRRSAEEMLSEVARVLKPGGAFLINIPVAAGWTKLCGVKVFPRRLLPFVPHSVVDLYLKMKGHSSERRKKSWVGYGGHTMKAWESLIDGHDLKVTERYVPGGTRGASKWFIGGQRQIVAPDADVCG